MKHSFKVFLQIIILSFFIFLSLRFGSTSEMNKEIFYELRLPRTIMAFSVGGLLALSGLLLQLIFFNPLCEPYTLGLTSGGTLGVIIAQSLALPLTYFGFSPWAFLGTFVFGLVLLGVSKLKGVNQTGLLITGVMLSFLGGSLVTLWMLLQDPTQSQSTLSYLFGDLSRSELEPSLLNLAIGLGAVFLLIKKSATLDSLLLGEDHAKTIGIPVNRVKMFLLIGVVLLVGLAVSSVGIIGFIGIMVPFFVRKYLGTLHRTSVFYSFIWGGGLLLISDLLSRTLIKPYEIPVGVVTSILGAPFFIYALLLKRKSNLK